MLIECNNKGCLQTSNALLNKETQEVICAQCGKAINGVSDAMRRTLSSFGQVLRSNERKAFMMACKNCNANREVVLSKDRNTVCSICAQPIKVHAAMKQAILEVGQKVKDASDNNDVDQEQKTKRQSRKKSVKQSDQ